MKKNNQLRILSIRFERKVQQSTVSESTRDYVTSQESSSAVPLLRSLLFQPISRNKSPEERARDLAVDGALKRSCRKEGDCNLSAGKKSLTYRILADKCFVGASR